MEYKLDTSHEKYIEVTVSGVIKKLSIIAAISELMQHPEYSDKHTLWDMSEALVGLGIGDLKEIAQVLRQFKPQKKNFANKSAIVVPNQTHKAIVDIFITMATHLPFKYRAFNDKEKAKFFLCAQ